MKKRILTLCLATLLLMTFMPSKALAYTNQKEWAQMSGSAQMEVAETGVSLQAQTGLNFWKYTKDPVDVNNFSVTFKLEQQEYFVEGGFYHTIMLTNKLDYPSSTGLFLLMMPIDEWTLRIEGQILNAGLLLEPTYVHFDVDTTKPITLHGTVVNGTHYRITLDGSPEVYEFQIPINFPFHTELDGKAFFSFGANTTSSVQPKITVTKVNDLDFTGVDPNANAVEEPTETPSTDDTNNEVNSPSDDTVSDDVNDDEGDLLKPPSSSNSSNNQNEADSSAVMTVLIVCICVLGLVIVGGVLFYVFYLRKKVNNASESSKEE